MSTTECLKDCDSHLIRNANDECECADPSHNVIELSTGKVCARDCTTDE
jgi:hypothetical protein